jgi:hypothetical protein
MLRYLTPLKYFGANLYDWWDFTDTSTQSITSGLINSITSKGTNAAVFSSSGTSRPASIVGINGLNVADFDGVNDFMEVATSTTMYNFLHNGVGTVIIVCKNVLDSTLKYILSNASGISFVGYRLLDGVGHVFVNFVSNGSSNILINSSGIYADAYNYLINIIDPANATLSERSNLILNQGVENKNNVTSGVPSSSNASSNLTIGKIPNASANFFNENIAEIIILNSKSTPTQITQLNNYYTNKYGGTFPIV